MIKRLRTSHALLLGSLGASAFAIGLKFGAHALGWEILTLNALLSGIVAADVFLMGFLITGVMGDYKEAERMPGELAASLEVLSEEGAIIYTRSPGPTEEDFLRRVHRLAVSLRSWFYRQERTMVVLDQLSELNVPFAHFESVTQTAYVVRMKQEQQTIRRALIRAHTIRETSFIGAGYRIAEWTTGLLAIALVLVRIDPFYESMFTVGVIVFLLSYLLLLIRDLENPFAYNVAHASANVSLKPLDDCIERLAERAEHHTLGVSAEVRAQRDRAAQRDASR